MARPLICDGCEQVIDSPVTPIKLVMNGPIPEEMQGMTNDEITSVAQMARTLGAGSPIPQTFLDFCSTLCVGLWGWRQATGLVPMEGEPSRPNE